MSSNIILKKSSVVSKVPLTTDLEFGELALNYADGKLYYKKSDGTTIDSFQAGSGGSRTRTTTIATGTSITMNSDTTDLAIQVNTQAAGTLTINAPTGTPVDGQKIMLRLTSTNAQTFSWNAIFGGSTDMVLPTTSSGSGKEDYIGFIYDAISTKWHLIAKSFGY